VTDDKACLSERFEAQRTQLRGVAYRMLGSLSEADDAVQEAWVRLSRTDAAAVENLGGWLTTVTGRVCLNMLRSRRNRRDEPVGRQLPDPVVSAVDGDGPEQAVLLADSVGLALLVVLETLGPAERLAFVLHDIFAVPFEEIAPMVGRSPAAARQLASRARRRVQGAPAVGEADLARQRDVVDAFFAAARAGDFGALVRVLDPDVVAPADPRPRRPTGPPGAAAVAGQALTYARPAAEVLPVLVNGAAGVVVVLGGRPVAVMGFTVADGRVVAIDALSDPARLAGLDLAFLTG
jgi:RNA polymerase sigma-70 factor (ECF subfamily)